MLIAAAIKLLGSAGFGTLFGGIMGIFNRKADLAQKKVELEHETKRWDHDLQLREADARIMQMEVQGKLQIATVQAEATVEAAGYEAMKASYDYAKPAAGGKMEALASFVRPAVTLGYYALTTLLTLWVAYTVLSDGFALDATRRAEMLFLVVDWTLAMAGMTIGWWFATRPGKALRQGSK